MRRREAYSYGCLLVRLPKPLADKVRGFGMSLPNDRLYVCDGKGDIHGGRDNDPHVTLKYGITTIDPDEVARAVESVEPFEVRLGRCGVFHNQDSVVLKLRVDSPGLVALHHRVCLKLDHVDTYRDYRPHITVAYMVKDERDPYYYRRFYDDSFSGEGFVADQLEFSTPAGNRYTLPFNGGMSEVARRMDSAERVASRVLMARLDVRISPMEHKVELSDGRRTFAVVGRPYELDRLAKALKWDITTISRMRMDEAKAYVEEKAGRKVKWEESR